MVAGEKRIRSRSTDKEDKTDRYLIQYIYVIVTHFVYLLFYNIMYDLDGFHHPFFV